MAKKNKDLVSQTGTLVDLQDVFSYTVVNEMQSDLTNEDGVQYLRFYDFIVGRNLVLTSAGDWYLE